jgi:hypothetical protein
MRHLQLAPDQQKSSRRARCLDPRPAARSRRTATRLCPSPPPPPPFHRHTLSPRSARGRGQRSTAAAAGTETRSTGAGPSGPAQTVVSCAAASRRSASGPPQPRSYHTPRRGETRRAACALSPPAVVRTAAGVSATPHAADKEAAALLGCPRSVARCRPCRSARAQVASEIAADQCSRGAVLCDEAHCCARSHACSIPSSELAVGVAPCLQEVSNTHTHDC